MKFHDTISENKLKTFTDVSQKSESLKAKGQDVVLQTDRRLFGQMILIAQSRKDLDMKDVLCHPLGLLPWSLATPEGKLRKTPDDKLSAYQGILIFLAT